MPNDVLPAAAPNLPVRLTPLVGREQAAADDHDAARATTDFTATGAGGHGVFRVPAAGGEVVGREHLLYQPHPRPRRPRPARVAAA